MGLNGKFLHVGFGGHALPEWAEGVSETTLDIDPFHEPDILAPMQNMGDIGKYNTVYSAHCLEHVHLYEARQTLAEMRRVLVDGGVNIVIVPNIGGIKPDNKVLYESVEGPICGLDLIYGPAWLVEECPFMAHKYGYTVDSLQSEFETAGFREITGKLLDAFNVMVVGKK